jgi:hypothetical protein
MKMCPLMPIFSHFCKTCNVSIYHVKLDCRRQTQLQGVQRTTRMRTNGITVCLVIYIGMNGAANPISCRKLCVKNTKVKLHTFVSDGEHITHVWHYTRLLTPDCSQGSTLTFWITCPEGKWSETALARAKVSLSLNII